MEDGIDCVYLPVFLYAIEDELIHMEYTTVFQDSYHSIVKVLSNWPAR